jgi:amino acid transporter
MDHKGVFSRKPVADIIAAEGDAFKALPKVLGPFSIIAMGVGAIIGAGIFVLTGTAAALYAGPALTISFVLAAIACVPGAVIVLIITGLLIAGTRCWPGSASISGCGSASG